MSDMNYINKKEDELKKIQQRARTAKNQFNSLKNKPITNESAQAMMHALALIISANNGIKHCEDEIFRVKSDGIQMDFLETL